MVWNEQAARDLMQNCDDNYYDGKFTKKIPYANILDEYKWYRKELWNDLKRDTPFLEIFDKKYKRFDKVEIRQFICAGIGSFAEQTVIPKFDTPLIPKEKKCNKTLKDAEGTHHMIACKGMQQMVFMAKIVGALKTKHPNMNVYIQEPRFTKDEIKFIEKSFGWTILNAAGKKSKKDEAQEHLGKSGATFLYCPAVDPEPLGEFLAAKPPQVYLGNRLDELLESSQFGKVNDRKTDYLKATDGELEWDFFKWPAAGTKLSLRWLK